MRVVKAAAVQLSPVLYSREGTVEKIVRTIHVLGQKRVQFATFPETVTAARQASRPQVFLYYDSSFLGITTIGRT